MAVGTVVSGPSQKAREQRRFGERQLFRRFPEPGARGGFHAARVAAEGHAVQICLEDFIFVHEEFQRRPLGEFYGFARRRARAVDGEAHDLAGYRRGAGDYAAAGDILPRGARDRYRVDAAMEIEAPVFEGYDCRRHPAPHLREGEGQPPFSGGGERAAQRDAVFIGDDERGGAVKDGVYGKGDDERRLGGEQDQKDDEGRPLRQPLFFEAPPAKRRRRL